MSRPAFPSRAFAETVLLALWLGAGLFFAAVVAPAAFAVLPGPELAGALVRRSLAPLFVSGIVVGVAVLVLDLRRGRSGSRLRRAAAGIMMAACASAHFVAGARIAEVRRGVGGPIGALAPDHPRRVAFGRLHALSVAGLGAAMVAAATAAVARGGTPPGTESHRGA